MLSRREPSEVQWSDPWLKRAQQPRANSSIPAALSGRGLQYSFSRAPARGMAELLDSYRRSAWLQAVVNRIGYHFAVVPWQLHERRDRSRPGKRLSTKRFQMLSGEFRHKSLSTALRLGELTEIESHPLLDLLDTPNSEMGGVAFRELCCKFIDFTGECFHLVVRDALGIPYQLWPLSPTWVRRIPTEDQPSFEFSILGVNMEVPREYVIYIRRHELLNPYGRGTGIGASLDDTIDIDDYAHKFLKGFYFNGARPDMIISLPGASEEVIADFQMKFENQTRGPTRAHRTFFADEEIKVDELRNDKGAEQSLPILNYVRDTFISVYGVPPEIMGVLGSSNRATINQAMTIFAGETLMPRLELFASEWQRQLVPLFDENLYLTYANPVPEDEDFRLNVAKAAPWSLSVREWRQLGGWSGNPEDFEFYMIPMGLNATDEPGKPILAPGQPSIGGVPGGVENRPQGGAVGELPATAPTTGTGQSLSQVTLNGAQMEALISILQEVVLGRLPRESAIEIILVAVPITREQAEAILGPIGQGFEPDSLPGQDPAPLALPEPDKSLRRIGQPLCRKGVDDPEELADGVLESFDPDYLVDEMSQAWRENVASWGDNVLAELHVDARFDLQNPRVKEHLKRFAGKDLKDINETTRSQLRTQLVEGFRAGEGYREMTARVRDVMGGNTARAENVARTEVTRSSNFASDSAYKQSGVIPRKEWIPTISDDRTRDEHLALAKEVVDIDEQFVIGSASADFPGDFGVPELDCNCRCTIAPVVDEPKSADDKATFWKKYDADTKPWEKRAQRSFLKAWKNQQQPILTALASLV